MPLLRAELERFADRYRLTAREHDVVFLLVTGFSTVPQIAERLSLSQNTVHNHFKNVFRRTHTNTKAGLLALFISETMGRQAQLQPLIRAPQVLIAESDPTERERMVEALRSRGIPAVHASNAVDAVSSIAESRIDLLVANVELTTADEVPLSRAVRDRFGRYPRILQVSREGANAGAEAAGSRSPEVLLHPVNGDHLTFAVLELCVDSPYARTRLHRVEETLPACVNRSLNARVENLGFGGAFVALDEHMLAEPAQFRVGSQINLEFRLEDRDSVNVESEIMWRRGSSRPAAEAGIGVRFVGLPELQRGVVEDFVRRRKLRGFASEMALSRL